MFEISKAQKLNTVTSDAIGSVTKYILRLMIRRISYSTDLDQLKRV